mgnify:CR=1 FL=1
MASTTVATAAASGSRVAQERPLAIFASSADDERRRRPADVFVLVVAGLLVLSGSLEAQEPTGFGAGLTATLTALPGWIDTLLGGVFAFAAIYVVGVLAVTIGARHRLGLLRDLLVAVVLAVLASFALAKLVGGAWPPVEGLFNGAGPSFPILRVAVLTAVALTATPHFVRPLRRFGKAVIAVTAVSAVALEFGSVADVVGAFGVGLVVTAVVHLLWGSPAGAPSRFRVRSALNKLGLAVGDLEPLPSDRGEIRLRTRGDDGRELTVLVYGRDAADSQLVAKSWRSVWYRDQAGIFSFTRAQQIEHEALLLMLARSAGASTAELVTTASTASGDRMLVVAPHIESADRVEFGAEHVERAWVELMAMHEHRIAFRRVDPRRIAAGADGSVEFDDWSAATCEASPPAMLADVAALLVLTACTIGAPRAVDVAVGHVDADTLEDAIAYIQPAALTPVLRRAVKDADLDLEELRTSASAAVGADAVELVQLQRVRLLNLALTLVAGVAVFLIIGRIIDIGLENILDTFEGATWSWIALALVVGQLTRLSDAWSALGASDEPLPYGPTVGLEFSVCFINVAAPCTAARISIETRYYQKMGIPAAKALTFGALDSLSLFIVQIAILLMTTVFGSSSLELAEADASVVVDIVTKLAVIAGVAVVVGLLVVAFTRRLREWVADFLRQAWVAVKGVRSFERWGRLFGGNLITQVLFSLTLGLCVLAFGYEVSFVDLMAINVVVALFSGLMPVPGGIGVSEFALTACLVAVGVPQAQALSAVIVHRMITYYLPPLWGYVALRWMRRHDYL